MLGKKQEHAGTAADNPALATRWPQVNHTKCRTTCRTKRSMLLEMVLHGSANDVRLPIPDVDMKKMAVEKFHSAGATNPEASFAAIRHALPRLLPG